MFFGSFFLGVYFFKNRELEYEFTGDEIIERRAGDVKNRMLIADVNEARVRISPHQLILKASNSKMIIRIFPSLNEVIQKKGAEMQAKLSEAERQRYEEAKRQMTSRAKWANIIGAIASVIAAILTALAIRWFTAKH